MTPLSPLPVSRSNDPYEEFATPSPSARHSVLLLLSANPECFLASTTTVPNRRRALSPIHYLCLSLAYFMSTRPTPLESSSSHATSPTLSSTSPPLPAPGAPIRCKKPSAGPTSMVQSQAAPRRLVMGLD